MPKQKLKREFYTRSNVLTISRELLGKLLVVPDVHGNRVSGRLSKSKRIADLKIEHRMPTEAGGRNNRDDVPVRRHVWVYFVYAYTTSSM